jgi:hypothetical protein
MATRKGKLLVLDVSGFLCSKVANTVYESPHGYEVIHQHYYTIVLRPWVRKFLKFCFDNYDVGFFSSSTYNTIHPLLEAILTEEQKQQTVFRWYRDQTEMDPEIGTNPLTDKFSTIKPLSKIISSPEANPLVGCEPLYNYYNVLICDDSPLKTRFNPALNTMKIAKFDENIVGDGHLKLLTKAIPERFQLLEEEDGVWNDADGSDEDEGDSE